MIYGFIIYNLAIFGLLGGVIFYLIPKLQNAHNNGDSEKNRLHVRQLYFTSGMIGILGLIFLLSMGFYFFSCGIGLCENGKENPGKIIFDSCLQSIPSLITLILGYYFGKKDNTIEQFKV